MSCADWPQLKKKRNVVGQGVNHAKVEVKEEEDTLMLGDGSHSPKSPGATGSEPASPGATSPVPADEPKSAVATSSKPSRGKGKGKGKKGGRGGRAPKEKMSSEDLGDLLPFAPSAIPRGDFELPYDIWWQNHHNGFQDDFEGKAEFKKIRALIGEEALATGEPDECYCETEDGVGCGENCVNRMMFMECSPDLCPCRDRCTNQRIAKRQNAGASLQRHFYGGKGVGIRAKKTIPINSFVLEYLGEVMTTDAYAIKVQLEYAGREHFHCLNLDSGLCIDGGTFGGEGRFINHSCEPNCHIEKWNVLGSWRIAIIASRVIQVGEELSYDYNFQSFGEDKVCKCCAPKCRGFMGAKDKGKREEPKGDKRKKKKQKKKKKAEKDPQVIIYEELEQGLNKRMKTYVRKTGVFLPRNYESSRRLIVKPADAPKLPVKAGGSSTTAAAAAAAAAAAVDEEELEAPMGDEALDDDTRVEFNQEAFTTKLQSLRGKGRAVRTRTLVTADADVELDRTAQLTILLESVQKAIANFMYEEQSYAKPFRKLPARKKHAVYYEVIKIPMCLDMLEENLGIGHYRGLREYVSDGNRVFNNALRFNKKNSDMWAAATVMKKEFGRLIREVRPAAAAIFVEDADEAKDEEPAMLIASPDEDLIRCLCNTQIDEGVMLQCTACYTWQHTWCVRVTDASKVHRCHLCNVKEYDPEIPMELEADAEAEGGAADPYTVAVEEEQRWKAKLEDIKPLRTALNSGIAKLEEMHATIEAAQTADKELLEDLQDNLSDSNEVALRRQKIRAQSRRKPLAKGDTGTDAEKQHDYDLLDEQYRRDIIPLGIKSREVSVRLSQTRGAEAQLSGAIGTAKMQLDETIAELEAAKASLRQAEEDRILAGRVDYWTLIVGGLQYRKGDCVYVDEVYDSAKHVSTVSKSARASKRAKAPAVTDKNRDQKKIIRIEKLWRDIDGNPFGYGDYYLKPRETIQKASRRFYRNELIYAHVKEIFSFSAVAGQCFVLPSKHYMQGRPKAVENEADVWICDLNHRYSVQGSSWSKRHSPDYAKLGFSRHPSVFDEFDELLEIQRRFGHLGTDFLAGEKPEASRKSKGKDKKSKKSKKGKQPEKRQRGKGKKSGSARKRRASEFEASDDEDATFTVSNRFPSKKRGAGSIEEVPEAKRSTGLMGVLGKLMNTAAAAVNVTRTGRSSAGAVVKAVDLTKMLKWSEKDRKRARGGSRSGSSR